MSESELVSSEVGKADKSLFVQELILTTLADSLPASPVTDEPVPDPQPRMVQLQQLQPHQQPQPDRDEDDLAKEEQAADRQQSVPALIEEKIDVTAVATEAIQVNGNEPPDVVNKNPDPSGDPLENSDEVIISPSETARGEDRGEDARVASAIRSKVQSHPPPPPIALRSTVHRNVRTSVVRDEPGSGARVEKPVFETHHTHKRLPTGSENRTSSVSTDDRTNRFESPDPTTTMAAATKKSCMNRRKTSDFKQ